MTTTTDEAVVGEERSDIIDSSGRENFEPEPGNGRRVTRLSTTFVMFLCIVVGWVALDQITKRYFDSLYDSAQAISDSILGIFRFRVIHNTGMAWGMFDDATVFLGVFALVVCAILIVYLFVFSSNRTPLEIVGASLVVAGGIGNAIDRFIIGYVVDFIEPTFIDFPVFNVADIGVTCGVVIFIIGLFVPARRIRTADA